MIQSLKDRLCVNHFYCSKMAILRFKNGQFEEMAALSHILQIPTNDDRFLKFCSLLRKPKLYVICLAKNI